MHQRVIEVEAASVPNQQTYDGTPFPLVLACHTPGADLPAATTWVTEHRDEIETQLAAHGTILFRDFPITSAAGFDGFISALGYPNFPYDRSLSNAVRVNRTERVFTANEAPPDVMIYLHHEMAQTPIHPRRILFYCEKAADVGGATPICRSDVLLGRLQEECPAFVAKCEESGLKYSNVMPPADDPLSGMGRSWQSTLRATEREQAEARLQELGYSWEWLPDGCLRATTPILPAVRTLPDGRKTFFNQLIAAFRGWKDERNDPSKAIRHGDDTPLDAEAVGVAIRLADELSFDVPWKEGDVALVDNLVVMHGRRTFEGTRRVLASLASIDSTIPEVAATLVV